MFQTTLIPFRAAPISAALAALLLTACGGGGSSPTPAPGTPVSTPPRFTSATTANVAENTTDAFYTATASDPQGLPVVFSVVPGGDADKFTISSGGALRFVSAPDHELPTDADGNNGYEVNLRATAGGEIVQLSLLVTVTNDPEGIAVKRVGTGFGADAVLTAPLRQPDLFAVKQDGAIIRISSNGTSQAEIANAFFAGESGRVMSVGHLNDHVMVMLDLDGKGVFVRAFPLSSYPHTFLETQLAEASATEPEGVLYNERSGFLWAALGDPSGTLAQDGSSGYGKLFRVQAFVNCGASVSGIWCMFDEQIGDGVHAPGGGAYYEQFSLLIDRGADVKDEITLYDANWRPLDYGWPFYEGDTPVQSSPPAAINGPSLVMNRGDGFRGASRLVGGSVYTGTVAQLDGKLIFGDISGKIFAFPAATLNDGFLHQADEVENRTADFTPDIGVIDRPTGFASDENGTLFVLDSDGELFRVDRAN